MAETRVLKKGLSSLGNEDQNVYSFRVTLFSDGEMYTLWLPKTPEGFLNFTDFPDHRFLSILAKEGRWVAACKKPGAFMNVPYSQINEMPLHDGQLVEVEIGERVYSIFTESVTRQSIRLQNFEVSNDVSIRIGNNPSCDIFYDSPYISGKHAEIKRVNRQWEIIDCSLSDSVGIFINGERRSQARLELGDVISILGLKIVIGINLLSINEGHDRIKINSQKLEEYKLSSFGHSYYSGNEIEESSEKYFNRLPRESTPIPQETITIEGPPISMKRSKMPLMLRMGSSMVMGGSAALTGHYTMLLSSVLFPLLSHKYTEKEQKEYEELRVTKYTEYLDLKRQEIENACVNEQVLLNKIYPPLKNISINQNQKKHLWERRPEDSDFLHIRLGHGTGKLSAELDYPEKHFELVPDELEEKMYQLVEHPHLVENRPIVISLSETMVCGVEGPKEKRIDFLRQILTQIATMHSYDEVKMAFLLEKADLEHLDFIRYLPHVWDDQKKMRFIATNKTEAYKIGEYLQENITDELDKTADFQKILKHRPYYLIFVLDNNLLDGHEFIKKLMQAENHGASFVVANENLPKETQKIIYLREGESGVCTTLSTNGSEEVDFTLDSYDKNAVAESLRVISNTKMKTLTQNQEMPKMITFLEMFKAGRIEQLNPVKRWRENNPVTSLEAPVGVGGDGKLFMLDLHEKRQGPHGLVAGMTGSGKSEFLITYILSMAVNYHPDEVAFVLIDYKGGGLAGAFENPVTGVRLPHLVGTITNLDGSSIQRSLMSIESELIRRQKVFNEVKSVVNEGTMDIYAYQKLYRAGKVSEPMPHLFIISDEFAELKQQQPEFMSQLISTARIGRSLGVHLILATQKPSGVVDEQIRSNAKFRVCLKVQDKMDSMDMLKRHEAAELTDTGRFYLQVGYNEYFAMGQSAWCGAPYEPQDRAVEQKDETIEVLDIVGQTISKAKPKVIKIDSGMKQIVATVKYLSELAEAQGIHPRQLCQPELPKNLDLDELQGRKEVNHENPMSVCLGWVDDPEKQEQFPLEIDFANCHNILITGDIGSGKTTVIQNILYSLAKQLPPEDFNFYALDYSSRLLKFFKPLPHCGAVLYEEETSSLENFFKLVNGIVADRKKLFSQLEVDSFETARQKKKIPLVLVVIDNLVGLSSSKVGENLSYKLQEFLKNSANYGVKYVISASHINEVSSRIRQELGERICLQMKDKFDYSEILGCKITYIPPDVPGRGLCKIGDRPLEFHGGMICAEAEEKDRIGYIKEILNGIAEKYARISSVQKLPVLDETASYEDFSGQFSPLRIPLGFSIKDAKPVAIPLVQLSTLGLYIGTAKAKKPIISNLLYAAQRENMEIWVAKKVKDSIFDDTSETGIDLSSVKNSDSISCTEENLRLLQQALLNQMSAQREFLESYYKENKLKAGPNSFAKAFNALYENTTPILLLIENVAEFCSSLSVIALMAYEELFSKIGQRNVYVVGCFEADDLGENLNNSLVALFSRGNLLLLGGKLDKQGLHSLPVELLSLNKAPYNVGIMRYRENDYPILMPCGEIVEEKETEADMESIF